MPKKGPIRGDSRPWLPHEEELLDKLWDSGLSASLVGEQLKRSRSSVLSNRRKRGLKDTRTGPIKHKEYDGERLPAITSQRQEAPPRYLKIVATEQEELEQKKQRLRELRKAAQGATEPENRT